jgi:DNA repair protein RecO (recombination protein O)
MNGLCKALVLMTESTVYLQPAFILQHRKYQETSLIIDALTQDFGRVSLLAKGVRKPNSKTAGLLQPFIPLTLSFSGKAALKTLADVEMIRPFNGLKGLALYCGFYINELICQFLHQYDPHPELFDHYSVCLSSLSDDGANIESALRLFELNLLECAGFGLQLEIDANEKPIEAFKKYLFDAGQGPVESGRGLFSGKTLQALNRKELTDPLVLSEAKILMRSLINSYLQGRPLKSRDVINKVFAAGQRLEK